jgi:hypothetical protein
MALKIHRPEGETAPATATPPAAAPEQPTEPKAPASTPEPVSAAPVQAELPSQDIPGTGVSDALAAPSLTKEEAFALAAGLGKDDGGSPQQPGTQASSEKVGVPVEASSPKVQAQIEGQVETSGEKVETILDALSAFAKSGDQRELYLVHKHTSDAYRVHAFDPETGYARLEGPYNALIRPRITEREVPKYEPLWRS